MHFERKDRRLINGAYEFDLSLPDSSSDPLDRSTIAIAKGIRINNKLSPTIWRKIISVKQKLYIHIINDPNVASAIWNKVHFENKSQKKEAQINDNKVAKNEIPLKWSIIPNDAITIPKILLKFWKKIRFSSEIDSSAAILENKEMNETKKSREPPIKDVKEFKKTSIKFIQWFL